MADATCSADNIGFPWPTAWGASGVLKIIADREFVSNGKPYPAGRKSDPINQNFCYQSAITVVGGVATFAAITLPQTDASDVQVINGSGTPLFTAIVYSNGGNTKQRDLFSGWHLSSSLGLTFNFAAWATDNNAPTVINPRSQWVDIDTLNRALAAIAYAPASATQMGLIETDVTPADTSRPIAVGLNSRRTLSLYNVQATAIGAVGDGTTNDRAALNTLVNTTLQIAGAGGDVYFPAGDYSIQSNMTFPANVRLVLDPRARLKPANGVTVTILGPIDAGPYQIFTNALSGQGTISLTGNSAVPTLYPDWWGAVTGTSASQSAAFQAALNNATGRTVQVGQGTWRIDTQLTFTNSGGSTPVPGFKLIGAGMLSTVFDSRVGSNAMLKIDANTGNAANSSLGFFFGNVVSDFQITTNSAAADGRGIDVSAAWQTEIARVNIQSLDDDGIRINNLGLADDTKTSVYLKIHHCSLRLNGGYGINAVESAGYIGIGLAKIEQNYIAQNTAGGISWTGAQVDIRNNTIAYNGDGVSTGFGLHFPFNTPTASATINVALNEFESNSAGNIRIDGGNNFVIESNNFNTGNGGVGPNIPLTSVVLGDSVAAVCDRIVLRNNKVRSSGSSIKGNIAFYINTNARGAYIFNTGFDDTYTKATITGTAQIVSGDQTVLGTGTTFNSTNTPVGWWINVADEWRKIASITSTTELEVETPFTYNISGSAIRVVQNLDYLDLGQDTQLFDFRASIIKQSTHWSTKTVAVAGVTTRLSLDDGVAQRLNFTAAGTQTIAAPVVSANSGQTVYQFDLELINNITPASNALVVAFDSGWVIGSDFWSPPSGLTTRAHFIYNPGAGNKWTQVGVWTPVVPLENTPAQITANQNDYNPEVPSLYQRWSTDASRNITGMTFYAAKKSGQTHYIINAATQDIVLVNNSGSSSAGNKFQTTTGADITLTTKQQAMAWYDLTSGVWRVSKMN